MSMSTKFPRIVSNNIWKILPTGKNLSARDDCIGNAGLEHNASNSSSPMDPISRISPLPDSRINRVPDLVEELFRLPGISETRQISLPPPILDNLLSLPSTTNQGAFLDPLSNFDEIILPQTDAQVDKMECENMLRIRREKMRRNRVSLEAGLRNEKARFEKLFQAEQVAILREAEEFDAEKHAKEVIAKVNYRPIPHFWKGKRLQEPAVIELMRKKGIDLDQFNK